MTLSNLKGKKVLLRVDFNVPFIKNKITDDYRICAELATIKDLLLKGAQVFIIAHLEQDGQSPHLDFVVADLQRRLKTKVRFIKGKVPLKPESFKEKIVFFDNIRLNPGEKNNDALFAKKLASWGDFYIDDAFGAMHRQHASIVGVPRLLPSALGPLVKNEMRELSRAFKPKKPFLFVLGGKKFDTKEPLISKFLESANYIFLCGALANTFLRERGYQIGKSVADDTKIPKNILWHKKIILPSDAIVLRGHQRITIPIETVRASDMISDAGTDTSKRLSLIAKTAKFILWNGTLGICETGFCEGTKKFADAIGRSKAYSIVGGGDTVAAIRQMKLEKNFDFISTGGGAMLEFLAKGTLPGIEALKKHK